MRKIIFLTALCIPFSAGVVIGQVVNETVDFDGYLSASDNDFQNRFDNGTGLVQLQTNGITGGCLETPSTIAWGNDNAVYCTHARGVIGVSYTLGICFKYDTTQLNNINFDRPASLWMKPEADPNHYLVASVLDTRRIQIISYSATASSPVMQLQQGHWYNLLLFADFSGGGTADQIDINSQVNDLGVTGNDPPIPAGFTNAVLHDSTLIGDTAIEISITGTHWGGALYLDNFRFDGMKSYDNCISTGIDTAQAEMDFTFLVEGNLLTVVPGTIQNSRFEVLNLSGQKMISGQLAGTAEFDISSFASGFYLLSVDDQSGRRCKKFFLIRN